MTLYPNARQNWPCLYSILPKRCKGAASSSSRVALGLAFGGESDDGGSWLCGRELRLGVEAGVEDDVGDVVGSWYVGDVGSESALSEANDVSIVPYDGVVEVRGSLEAMARRRGRSGAGDEA